MNDNRVRIIGGAWRSRRITFPDGRGLRPTPDRVRETLFNWLGQDLSGLACLDLFAGSGALGFEAASRGARRVVLVERERATAAALEASRVALEAVQVEVRRAEGLEFLRSDGGMYDVVFLDPPFADAPWPALFERLPARLAPAARVYCESGATGKPGAAEGTAVPPADFTVLREARAGQVHYRLLQWTGNTDKRLEQP